MACVLLAGELGSGKTTVAQALAPSLGGEVVRVREALAQVLGIASEDRATLQREGADLDRRTNGRWLVEYLAERLDGLGAGVLVVDAVRTQRQTAPVLERVPGSHLVYLAASAGIRRRRFELAALHDPVKRSMSFDRASEHPTERESSSLRTLAEVVVESDDMTPQDVVSFVVGASRDW